MVINNTQSAKEFKKYFDLFNDTVEYSTFFKQNSKDFLQEKFNEIIKCIDQEIINQITVNDPITVFKKIEFDKLLIIGDPLTGKTRLANHIATYFNNPIFLDGRKFNIETPFVYHDVKIDTDLIVFDDVECIKSLETIIFRDFSEEKMKISRKFRDNLIIDTPRLIIIGDKKNFPFEQFYESIKRRLLIIEL